MSARPSVGMSIWLSAWNNSAPTGPILMKFDIKYSLKTCHENSIFINSHKKKGYFTLRKVHISDDISLSFT